MENASWYFAAGFVGVTGYTGNFICLTRLYCRLAERDFMLDISLSVSLSVSVSFLASITAQNSNNLKVI